VHSSASETPVEAVAVAVVGAEDRAPLATCRDEQPAASTAANSPAAARA